MKNSTLFDSIVIGGGPAGFISAIALSQMGCKSLLLEKENQFLKKFRITGSGKCNLTHQGNWEHFSQNYGTNSRFLKKAFYQFDNQKLLDFFENKAIEFYCTDEGKYFPKCESADKLASILIESAQQAGVLLQKNQQVSDIIFPNNNSPLFEVRTTKEVYYSKNILLATGGNSFPSTGSDGKITQLAKQKGISVIEPKPSLCALCTHPFPLSDFSGLSFAHALITVIREQKVVLKEMGPLLITPDGFSGPLILNNSRDIRISDLIEVSFTGEEDTSFLQNLKQAKEKEGKKQIQSIIHQRGIPTSLAKWITEEIAEEFKKTELKIADCSNAILKRVTQLCCRYPFNVHKTTGWKRAMATAGGIDLKKISPSTMESKQQSGLYFAGEIMDIDGNTGGYNLQAAFSTGYSAATAISRKDKQDS